jgi:hypothetical protein
MDYVQINDINPYNPSVTTSLPGSSNAALEGPTPILMPRDDDVDFQSQNPTPCHPGQVQIGCHPLTGSRSMPPKFRGLVPDRDIEDGRWSLLYQEDVNSRQVSKRNRIIVTFAVILVVLILFYLFIIN